ncbi:uncharacterized protein LOC128892835 isoform X2 [Hylaeus anthracinus]|uniref:uncharacterized protein LOC128892835 isoform X2 n=1 Tax=Hylaeus anthracinus TaxID=313031 RepID=UPI0023B98E0A|nr:uncharacterized protein LOC128892835 isoform X2 [Hylaeus anthracinus]
MVKLVVTLLAVFCIVNFVDSAAVKSEEFAEQLRRIVHDAYPDSLRIQRATESGRDSSKRNCYDTPCGWNAYNPQTRQTTIFMPNTCKCPDETYKCVRTGENVSMGAYVYHCRQNVTATLNYDSPYDMDSDYLS